VSTYIRTRQSSLSEHGTLNTEHILTDYQNSVIATLTPTPTLYAYSPFGKLRYTNSEGTPQPLGWLGRQYDSETGNNYLINRYYSSDRGNFLSPDQYEYVNNAIPFTFNLYQYGYANPLRYEDRDGLAAYVVNARNKDADGNYVNEWLDFAYEVDGVHVADGEVEPIGVHLNDIPTPKTQSLEFLLKDDVLVFVHGFNVNEDEAIWGWTIKNYNRLRAAGFKGDMVVLSWEGDEGSVLHFQRNVKNADQAARNFARLIQRIRLAKPNARVNVGGHSLGVRVILSGLKYAEDNIGLPFNINSLVSMQAAVDWRDVTVGARYHDFGNQNPYHWYNLSSPADQKILGMAYGASEVSQSILKSSPYRLLNGILGIDLSGIMATLKNPVLGLFCGMDWAVNKGALGTMEHQHPKLGPYYNGYYGGNFPSDFRLIDTEQFGINDHSAMKNNVYRKPGIGEKYPANITAAQKVPVADFWSIYAEIINSRFGGTSP